MNRTWVAIICVVLLVILAAASVFFATAGGSWLAEKLADGAKNANPGWAARLYRWSLAVNPYDASVRLALFELYQQQGKVNAAEQLLREGVSKYSTGPSLYLALASTYANSGRLEEACSLLDGVPSGYLSRRISILRPDNARAPDSGTYAAGLEFPLTGGEGTAWYQLNGGPWTLYGSPLALQEGRYTLRVVTLDGNSIPSPVDEYRYTVEQLQPAAVTYHLEQCPYCGEAWMEADK